LNLEGVRHLRLTVVYSMPRKWPEALCGGALVVERKPYPSDVGDEAWALVAPYLTLLDEAVPQRR
jgi:hypothetical protein